MNLRDRIYQLDALIIRFMNAIGVPFLRIGIGVVFIWFGGLKVVDLSPATELLAATVYWWTPEIIVPVIGYWEVLIGVFFLIPPLTRVAILLLAPQMVGTFLPLVLLPSVCWDVFPWGLTLEGQYIVKNLVVIGAALVIGSRMEALRTERRLQTREIPLPVQ
ncbi:DoxX family protein [Pontimonas sp.]|jgi:uncharacterized membrane protein YkgB|uniref:DoxX family protein n=1 Tax=Pontimonas sp. TaxID=2304492 RepID=UPI0028709BF4|nr:DoxX family protein [Pontimonas sp.]MDR9397039.1 DoxX family protein [Pontimonas sp.]MDR9434974.1 DoxX family protein [Pontimonas sp.]